MICIKLLSRERAEREEAEQARIQRQKAKLKEDERERKAKESETMVPADLGGGTVADRFKPIDLKEDYFYYYQHNKMKYLEC